MGVVDPILLALLLWIVVQMRKMKMSGDEVVIGMVSGFHILADINMQIPYGVAVHIPAEKALRSKDLWRAISQRCVARLPKSYGGPQNYTPPPDKNVQELEQRVRELTQQMDQLRAQNQSQQAIVDKLDQVLRAVTETPRTTPQPPTMTAVPVPKVELSPEIDGSAPTFIPSRITPDNVEEVRVQVQGEQSDTKVSEAASALRKMRRKGPKTD